MGNKARVWRIQTCRTGSWTLDTLDSGSKLSVFGHTRSRPSDSKNSLSSPHRHNLHKPDCFFCLNDSSHGLKRSDGQYDFMVCFHKRKWFESCGACQDSLFLVSNVCTDLALSICVSAPLCSLHCLCRSFQSNIYA